MDLNELSFDRLGSWPIRVRIVALTGAFVFTLILGYLFLIRSRLTQLHNLEKQQSSLKSWYQSKHQQVIALPEYEDQLISMQKTVTTLNSQLITANEISKLIDMISKLAIANNLEINLIKPGQKSTKDFYTAMPISIVMTGDYHHFALFISQLSALQKILVFDDFTMITLNRKAKDDSDLTLLEMNVTATVYMRP
jgi:type IV pilus assembly protein PilO